MVVLPAFTVLTSIRYLMAPGQLLPGTGQSGEWWRILRVVERLNSAPPRVGAGREILTSDTGGCTHPSVQHLPARGEAGILAAPCTVLMRTNTHGWSTRNSPPPGRSGRSRAPRYHESPD